MAKATHNMTVRFPLELIPKLKKLSQKKQQYMSELIIQFVSDGLDKPEPKRRYERKAAHAKQELSSLDPDA